MVSKLRIIWKQTVCEWLKVLIKRDSWQLLLLPAQLLAVSLLLSFGVRYLLQPRCPLLFLALLGSAYSPPNPSTIQNRIDKSVMLRFHKVNSSPFRCVAKSCFRTDR